MRSAPTRPASIRRCSEAGIEPDWVIGTSIGAINASLIAGNPPERRLERLRRILAPRDASAAVATRRAPCPLFGPWAANMMTIAGGLGGFFEPNPLALLGLRCRWARNGPAIIDQAAERTLEELIDPVRLNKGSPRLTVGAANVQTGEMHYFDSRETRIDGAAHDGLGRAAAGFPAVRIGDDLYWDGGILSNTPVEAVFDDNPRRSGIVFAVHMWAPSGPEPDSIWKVLARQKDLQYSSRAASHIVRQKQLHRLRHVIARTCREVAAGDCKLAGGDRTRWIWLRDAHACRASAGAAAGRRGPFQGHRFQPQGH